MRDLDGSPAPRPDPEVVARAKRRRFTAEYKRRILAQADAAKAGVIGALLRREGLYSSLLLRNLYAECLFSMSQAARSKGTSL
jgi:transposase-like protein